MRSLYIMGFILALTLMLSACGQGDPAGDAAGTGAAEISAPGVLPIVPNMGDVTLRFLVVQHPAIIDWSTNAFVLWMEEQTNVKVEFETITYEGREERVGLILAAGADLPDAFVGGAAPNTAQVQRFGVGEGLLMPLNDLIDTYGHYVNQVWELFPDARSQLTYLDGNIYSMPNINECFHCSLSHKMWINQNWLDALGLSIPTTTDELYEVLLAFRDGDPNGDGSPTIPMASAAAGGWQSDGFRFIMNSFLYFEADILGNPHGTNLGFGLDGDTVISPWFQVDEMKEALHFINKLFREGLWDEASFTLTGEQLTTLVENPDGPLVGAFFSGWSGIHSRVSGDRYRAMRAVLPLRGPRGVQGTVHDMFDAVQEGFFLSATNPHPEITIRWADYLLSFDATIRSYLGVKNEGWREPLPGEVGINGLPALYYALVPWQEFEPQNEQLVQQIISFRPASFRLGEAMDVNIDLFSEPAIELLLQVVSEEYYPFGRTENKMPPVRFTREEADATMIMRTEITSTIREWITAFMRGERDIDNEYEDFVALLRSLGMDDLMAKYQSAYDAQFR